MGDRLRAAAAPAVDGGADILQRALELAETDPQQALDVLEKSDPTAAASPEERGVAALARGLALQRLGRREPAASALSEAVELLARTTRRPESGRARVALAAESLFRGRVEEAMELLQAADHGLTGRAAARVAMQRALVLQRAGRVTDTLDDWTRALRVFRREGDLPAAARAHGNRGLVHAYRGEYASAEADLRAARLLFTRAEDPIGAAEATHNEGFVAARRGDLPTALRLFDEAQEQLRLLGAQRPEMLLDRAETLLDAGVAGEARRVGEVAVTQLQEAGREVDRAEAALLVARACEESGALGEARRWAETARELFAAQQRPRWELLAEYRALRVAAGERGPEHAARLAAMAVRLEEAGWLGAAIEAGARAVVLGSGCGRLVEAAAALARLDRLRRKSSPMGRLECRVASAHYLIATRDAPGVERALAGALDAAREHQLGLGSVELRARVAEKTAGIVGVAVRHAAAVRRPDRALYWAEAARSVEAPGVVAPKDGSTIAALEALRQVSARLEGEPLEPRQQLQLRRRQAALEEVVRRRTRYLDAAPGAAVRRRPARQLLAALGSRTLVEYMASGSELWAVVGTRGGCRLLRLAELTDVRRAVGGLRLAMSGAVRGHDAPAGDRAVRDAAHALEEMVVLPVLDDIADATGVVVVPTGAVASVPWAALPSLRGRELVVSPSLTSWARAEPSAAAPAGSGRVVAVAGPGLRNATREADLVAGLWGRQGRALSGQDATAAAVLRAMSGADVVHVAAHGRFRADNPLLSSIQLADGPVSAYELLGVSRPPRIVVFSSCESGMADSEADGTFGVSGMLHRAGVQSVVASVAPVHDDDSPELMRHLHSLLRAGVEPAAAVARVTGDLALAAYVSAPAFVCFGR